MDYAAKWKVLEDLMINLRKNGVEVPPNIIGDFQSSKAMIEIGAAGDSKEDATAKLEEVLANLESYLVAEAQKVLGVQAVDRWFRLLDEASLPTCGARVEKKKTFVTGVPRDQKWVRVEPLANLPTERLLQIAKESTLSVNQQKDGRLVVYGQQEGIRIFLKKMTEEAGRKQ
jgi:hypothetical protein